MVKKHEEDEVDKAKKAAYEKAAEEAHGHGKEGKVTKEKEDHRNYPRSPEPGKGPEPYPSEGPLPTVDGDPTPPAFPIGTEPEPLGIEPKTTGDTTDMARIEAHNEATAGETPAHCPDCRGRGFIGGAVCPTCGGTGLDAGPKSKKSTSK